MPTTAICGGCRAKGLLVFYCVYLRLVIILVDGSPKVMEYKLYRYICGCGKTHVIAPGELIIPYGRYSLEFILAVLEAYIKREKPVRQIAADFLIVVSTIYAWIKKFKEHYELLLGKLQAVSDDIGEYLENILSKPDLSYLLFKFAETFEFCFLQRLAKTHYFTLRGQLVYPLRGSP